jgi:hypothetical protein
MATQRTKQKSVATMRTIAFMSLARMCRTKIVPHRGRTAAQGA